MLGPRGPEHYIFENDFFFAKNATKLRFRNILQFHARKHMIPSFYLKPSEFTKSCKYFLIMGSRGPSLNWNKAHHFLGVLSTSGKIMVSCFPAKKMEEYMKSQLSEICQVKLVGKSIKPGSPGTHFMHMGIKTVCSYFIIYLIDYSVRNVSV